MICVIIPVFNAENTIDRALASVREQSWPGSFEIIIVNDGSTDQSVEKIEDFRLRNPSMNITLLHQQNRGVSAARNAAMTRATGDYIALLDADDEWLPEKTERQMRILSDPTLNIPFLACKRVGQKLLYPYRVGKNKLAEITFRKLMLRNEVPTPTVMFKRSILEVSGYYNENQRFAEDLNFLLKISAYNKMFILDEELVITGGGKRSFGVSGLSGNLAEMEKGFQQNLKEMLKLRRINSAEFAFYFIFYRFKYLLRLFRNQFLKQIGK